MKHNKDVGATVKNKKNGSMRSIFMHADGLDMWLMDVGFIRVVVDGSVSPLLIYLTGRMFNNGGGANYASDALMLAHNLCQVALYVVLTTCGGWVGSFFGEFEANTTSTTLFS
ncbi:hypothetical protein V6N13_061305 [Hibiscus sabdariffa]|uniref:Uncharacterized protein n=1 Tax=Hibiscus sabdariffa TaxID=183260 RepID=A0ABR2EG52_9ROSI